MVKSLTCVAWIVVVTSSAHAEPALQHQLADATMSAPVESPRPEPRIYTGAGVGVFNVGNGIAFDAGVRVSEQLYVRGLIGGTDAGDVGIVSHRGGIELRRAARLGVYWLAGIDLGYLRIEDNCEQSCAPDTAAIALVPRAALELGGAFRFRVATELTTAVWRSRPAGPSAHAGITFGGVLAF